MTQLMVIEIKTFNKVKGKLFGSILITLRVEINTFNKVKGKLFGRILITLRVKKNK